MELEKLREDVYFELKDRGCSIGIFEVFTYNTLSRGQVKSAFECKKRDSSDIAKELVAYIFEIGENQLKED